MDFYCNAVLLGVTFGHMARLLVAVRRGQVVKERILHVRLPEELYCRLVSVSITADRPMSNLMRRALETCIAEWEQTVKTDRCALL